MSKLHTALEGMGIAGLTVPGQQTAQDPSETSLKPKQNAAMDLLWILMMTMHPLQNLTSSGIRREPS
jgi:hypothetical protein